LLDHGLKLFGMADDVIGYQPASWNQTWYDQVITLAVDFFLGIQEAKGYLRIVSQM